MLTFLLINRRLIFSRHSARISRDRLQRLQVLQSFGGADLLLAHAGRGRQGDAGLGRDDGADLERRRNRVCLSKVRYDKNAFL